MLRGMGNWFRKLLVGGRVAVACLLLFPMAVEGASAKQAAPKPKKPAPAPKPVPQKQIEAPKVAQVAAATDMRAKVATAPEKMPEAPKSNLMKELEDDGDGSSWVATAVKNAEAAPTEVAQIAKQDDLANGVRIHHDRNRAPLRKPAPAPAPVPAPASAPQPQAQPQQMVAQKQDNPEDGVVLRWR